MEPRAMERQQVKMEMLLRRKNQVGNGDGQNFEKGEKPLAKKFAKTRVCWKVTDGQPSTPPTARYSITIKTYYIHS
jgi:hypothetical protein